MVENNSIIPLVEKKMINPQQLELQQSLAKGKTVIGIDIGSSSVNIAQTALYQGKSTLIKVVIENINFVNEQEKDLATVEALNRALAHFNFDHADVVCTISNQKSVIEHMNMPLMPPAELADAIKLEVVNSAQFALENPIVAFRVLGRITDKGVEKISVMVVAVAKSSVDNILVKFKSQRADPMLPLKTLLQVEGLLPLNITQVIPMSISLENIIKKSRANKQETLATLEIGSMSAELNIYRDTHLEFSRKINVTGVDFTRSLTSAMFTNIGKVELTLEEAEWIKKEHGIPLSGEDSLIKGKVTANQVLTLLRPRLEQIVKEVTRSFDFYRDKTRNAKIDKLILFGGGAMLKRLPEFLNMELGMPVGVGNPVEDVNLLFEGLLDQKDDMQRLSLAIGASLSEPGGAINLLPEELRDSKKKYYKKLTIFVIGIAFLVGSILGYVGLLIQLNKVKENATKAKNEYRNIVPQFDNLKNKQMLGKSASYRPDLGGLLKQLSHSPDKVFITELILKNENLTLNGMVTLNIKEAKAALAPLVEDLKKGPLRGVRVSSTKEIQGKMVMTSFTIVAKLELGGSDS